MKGYHNDAPSVRLVERVIDPFGNKAMVEEGQVIPQKSLLEWGLGTRPNFRSMWHVDYDYARDHNYLRFAFSWDEVVREAVRAIGPEDTRAWLSAIQDILADPCFARVTLDREVKQLWTKYPGRTLVSAHNEAWHKLGYYMVWRPGQEPEIVQGESAVRAALLENRMCAL